MTRFVTNRVTRKPKLIEKQRNSQEEESTNDMCTYIRQRSDFHPFRTSRVEFIFDKKKLQKTLMIQAILVDVSLDSFFHLLKAMSASQREVIFDPKWWWHLRFWYVSHGCTLSLLLKQMQDCTSKQHDDYQAPQ